jgi:hypothetical protein
MGLHPTANSMLEGVNGGMLIVADNGWRVLDGTREPVNAVGNTILWGQLWNSKVMMSELQGVRDTGALGVLGDDVLASVMIVRHANVPSRLATEVP